MDKRVKSLILIAIILSSIIVAHAIDRAVPYYPIGTAKDSLPQDSIQRDTTKQKIIIKNVDLWSYDKNLHPDYQVLKGHVIFMHKNALMYCDSAHLYEKNNKFIAYSQVRINQGDSIHIYCDELAYDGTTLMAQLTSNVKLVQDGGATMYTDKLYYDRATGEAYYNESGTIADSVNTLSSIVGIYSTVTKKAVFNDKVKLKNENFTMYSDTLNYNTETKIADISGPTRIVSDSSLILTKRGIYDTVNDRSYLLDRSQVYSGARELTGDSIFYDKKAQVVQVFNHVEMRDTTEKKGLFGNFAEYHEDTKMGFARDSAYMMDYSSPDTLYAHATLLEMTQPDSTTHIVRGLGNVRIYRNDMQATSDTIMYSSRDSIMSCIGHPFMWSDSTQITGDTIKFYMKNGQLNRAHVYENAFVIQPLTDQYFNQIKGNEIFAYFGNNQLDSVWIKGSAETIYFMQEKDSTITGNIKMQSSAIFIQFLQQQIYKIKLMDKIPGTLTPIALVKPKDLFFPDFTWFISGRPTNKGDIFRTTPMVVKGEGRPSEKETAKLPEGVTSNDSIPADSIHSPQRPISKALRPPK